MRASAHPRVMGGTKPGEAVAWLQPAARSRTGTGLPEQRPRDPKVDRHFFPLPWQHWGRGSPSALLPPP
eukprot:14533813-Alexandrium_andersonii.AAC.1